MNARLAWLVFLVGCTAIRPLDPVNADGATRDGGGFDASGLDASGLDAFGLDASSVDASGLDAFGPDARSDAATDSATSDASLHPDTSMDANCQPTEACGGGDEDCDGLIDEMGATGETTYYMDADGDTYGAETGMVMACTMPTTGTWVTRGGDCDDTNASVHPGHVEVSCNGEDDDCNGTVDDGTGTCGGLGCTLRHDASHAYLFCEEQRTQTEAETQCEMYGYQLVEIDDAEENDFVRTNLPGAFSAMGVWIGLEHSTTGSMPYVWIDGTPLGSYAPWDAGEPNLSGTCTRIRATTGLWSDSLCTNEYSYVCESP